MCSDRPANTCLDWLSLRDLLKNCQADFYRAVEKIWIFEKFIRGWSLENWMFPGRALGILVFVLIFRSALKASDCNVKIMVQLTVNLLKHFVV